MTSGPIKTHMSAPSAQPVMRGTVKLSERRDTWMRGKPSYISCKWFFHPFSGGAGMRRCVNRVTLTWKQISSALINTCLSHRAHCLEDVIYAPRISVPKT